MTTRSVLRSLAPVRRLSILRQQINFGGSAEYWERRYLDGGSSGVGSYGDNALAKAEFINSFIARHAVRSVIEFGCGDGNQLALAQYPRYIGLDVSRCAIGRCKDLFAEDASKSFFLYDTACFIDRAKLFQCDAALSLDVIFHLVEDSVYELYMRHLFESARKFVVIYSTDTVIDGTAPHVRHRRYSDWVRANQPDWTVIEELGSMSNAGAVSEFRVYVRQLSTSAEEL